MKVVSRTAASAMLLALPLALGACGDSKPEKAEVQSGFAKIMKDQPGMDSLPEGSVDKVSKCVTDKVYDEVSNETLKAMASGESDAKGNEEDQDALNKASTECGKEVAGG